MKERMKRVAALLLCLLMAFSLAACGDGGGGTGENIGGTDADTANTPGDTSSADDAAAGFVVADTDEEI